MEEQILSDIKKLKINNGDIVVLKSDKITYEQTAQLKRMLEDEGTERFLLIKLGSKDDIELIPEEQMNRFGWYKK